LRKNKRGNLKK